MIRTFGLPIQLLLMIVLPVALVLMVVAIGGAVLHEQAMRELVGSRDARATQAAADNLNERLEQLNFNLSLLATSVDLNTDLSVLYTSQIEQVFDYGLVLTQNRDNEIEAVLPMGAWDWRAVPDDRSMFVQHQEDQVLVMFVVAVPDSDVYLYGATSLAALGISELLKSLVTDAGTNVYLVDVDGHILYANDVLQIGDSINPPEGSGFRHSEGDLVIAYSSVPRVGWALVIEEPWHTVSSPQLRASHSVLLVIILMALLGLVTLAFSALGVVRPLQRLEGRANRLVQGEFEAIVEPVGGIREIRDVQTALIKMAQSVQQAQARLHDYIGAITTAQEDERSRLARDLHDDVIQTLIALNQQAQKAQRQLDRDPAQAKEKLSEVRQISEQVVQDIRQLIHGLRPSYLSELGLVAALEMLTEQGQEQVVTFNVVGDVRRLPDQVELALYRIAQEALSNVRKHSQATSVNLRLVFEAQQVCLQIEDNGKGFNVPTLQRLPLGGHYGLLGIQERVQLIGGELNITSAPQQGTTLSVRVHPQS